MESEPPKNNNKSIKKNKTEETMAGLKNITDILSKASMENYDNSNKKSDAKLNEIEKAIEQLASSLEICQYLYGEKRKCMDLSSKAKFGGDGIDRKLYQKFIDEIIEPRIKTWEGQLDFDKKNPPPKQSSQVENISGQKILEKNIDVKISNEVAQTDQVAFVQKGVPETIGIITEVSFETNKTTNQIVEKVVPPIIKIVPQLPVDFTQISCEATADEIEYYFMILAKEKNPLNNKIYMEEAEVLEFVKNNFSSFECVPTGKYFSVNLFPMQEKTLTYFMFEFYLKYDRKVAYMKKKYGMLLINNFTLFKNKKVESLLDSMCESKKPKSLKNIIQIEQYFSPKKLPKS